MRKYEAKTWRKTGANEVETHKKVTAGGKNDQEGSGLNIESESSRPGSDRPS